MSKKHSKDVSGACSATRAEALTPLPPAPNKKGSPVETEDLNTQTSCSVQPTKLGQQELLSLEALSKRAGSTADVPSPRIGLVLEWARSFLSLPHSDLGRPGHVCPFVKPALDTHKSLYFSEIDETEAQTHRIQQKLLDVLRSYLDLINIHGPESPFLAAILVMPGSHDGESGFAKIKTLQERLKPQFATQGLMIGQVHPLNTEPGLHNFEFRPLQSPVPLFVYRIMQINDLPFLIHNKLLINAYKSKFNLNTRADLKNALSAARIPQLPIGWEGFVDQAFD